MPAKTQGVFIMWWSLFLIDHDASEFDNGALSYQPVVSYESRPQCENGRLSYIDKGEFNLLLKQGWELHCIKTDEKVSETQPTRASEY